MNRQSATEHELPGIGRRDEPADTQSGRAVVAIHHGGRRDLYGMARGAASLTASPVLTHSEARTLGAVPAGAHFTSAVVEEMEAVIGEPRPCHRRAVARRPPRRLARRLPVRRLPEGTS